MSKLSFDQPPISHSSWDGEYVSNCCNTRIDFDTEICPRCKEGCEAIDISESEATKDLEAYGEEKQK